MLFKATFAKSVSSLLSVAALADLGYTVDFTQAEHYVLPVRVVV